MKTRRKARGGDRDTRGRVWDSIFGSRDSETQGRQRVRSRVRFRSPSPAPTEVGLARPRRLRGSPRCGRVCQCDWGLEESRTYVGLKAGGEMPHSGTPAVATTAAAGGEPIPELPNGRCTPSRPRAAERALPGPAPFCRPRPIRSRAGPVSRPRTPSSAPSGRSSLRMILPCAPPYPGAFCSEPCQVCLWAEPSSPSPGGACWACADLEAGTEGKSCGNPAQPPAP